MEIISTRIKIKDLFQGYRDDEELGVRAYNDRLNVRPIYQREFVYTTDKSAKVIDTIIRGLPLGVMYWSKESSGDFELIDGQQRTISICRFLENKISITYKGASTCFRNLPTDVRESIREYSLQVFLCEGTDSEKLEWFETINIAGEKLTKQELRNAVYTGEWLASAKRLFSKANGQGVTIVDGFVKGDCNRQEVLEEVLSWAAHAENLTIEEYMGKHRGDFNANALRDYVKAVINWVTSIYPDHSAYAREMRNIHWGYLYNDYKDKELLPPSEMAEKVQNLMVDDDVTSKTGIFKYLIDDDERHLNIRTFSDAMKRSAYGRQGHKCALCGEIFGIEQMEADHIVPWSEGGKTIAENCQMLCKDCNRRKSNK